MYFMPAFWKRCQIKRLEAKTLSKQGINHLSTRLNDPAGLFGRKRTCYLIVFLIVTFLTSGMMTGAAAKNLSIKENKPTIVLDPGHGGYDTGAQGPDGTFEKTVTLNLARMISEKLSKKYRLQLTRTDDYSLDIYSRTAVANHLKADLFIGIHTGGSFLHTATGISIFYFNEISETALVLENEPSKPVDVGDTLPPWDYIQNRHKTTSKVLARLIQHRFIDQIKSTEIRIQGAPIMVLEGADMPAILIEIGYLTNPSEEKRHQDKKVLSDLVKAISNGIDDFFNNNESH